MLNLNGRSLTLIGTPNVLCISDTPRAWSAIQSLKKPMRYKVTFQNQVFLEGAGNPQSSLKNQLVRQSASGMFLEKGIW